MNNGSPHSGHSRARLAFTLIELLVVIAIIGVLIGLLLPAVQKVREAANRAKCTNNLKQLGLACHAFHDAYNYLPAGVYGPTSNGAPTINATPAAPNGTDLSWLVYLLPFIEQGNLYNLVDFTQAYNAAYTVKNINSVVIPTLLCPSCDQTQQNGGGVNGATTHYQAVMGPRGTNPQTGAAYTGICLTCSYGGSSNQGMMYANSQIKITDCSDGTSNTFLVGELSWLNCNAFRPWTRGWGGGNSSPAAGNAKNIDTTVGAMNLTAYDGKTNFNDVSFGSQHPGGCNFCFSDGSVRFVGQNIDMNTYVGLASRNGGEVLKQVP